MSLETWKKEFYSTPAYQVKPKDAVEHSIKKWKGLTRRNLKKHGLSAHRTYIFEQGTDNCLGINGRSCALCVLCWESAKFVSCSKCPIYKITGKMCGNEYDTFNLTNNPQPMIRLLNRVNKALTKK